MSQLEANGAERLQLVSVGQPIRRPVRAAGGNSQALQSYLAGYRHLRATPTRTTSTSSRTAPPEQFDKALGVTQQQYKTAAVSNSEGTIRAQTFHGVSGNASLPNSIAQTLVAILGLTNYQPSVSNAKRAAVKEPKQVASSAISPSVCVEASGLPNDCNLPSDFASEYGLDGLYSQGATGQGQTLGIITFASVDPGAPQYFWKNIRASTAPAS